ncbi:iron-sulfur cluster insertion protein erpA [Ehrlichia chaffeensis str. Heartland]|uniref:Iron-sulfur cluster assembly accessory protein n=1 Tax=Ehrlichia chaffeensis (strain ATCC CRL-10679 / Arkansas) TaxID=205920 RepID=Q2GGD9_EHRCR|nr:iron-sulfur cluster biosynthesis family protein [Ehrlichia chaffeensis]ABD44667.1 iron-sulfur cluster assembly accessory protein [Ehrlichia chaffeensis str. Arkansas]AHX03759.1 iron-sulfur cluster insertion protein erpA [Ehrlichia chaffeensis str. Heartland]AHX05514.1 iron-sulfur cluster insertion protein erpA [Ehrlichia chaffeensis str. Jax]AHX06505.1 iron-sulfur cluster insertion protein erpA [Ehrlichia chaffeensis str. Liberty]AHX07175.1 iron-sulfur cluster insertion protein erpA [Ehrlic
MSNLKSADLTLTENAVNKIKHLIDQEEDADSLLCLSVSGGGCSGFQYNFNICNINTLLADDEDDEDDDYDFLDDDDEEYDDEDELEGGSSAKFTVFDEETGKPLLLIDQASNNLLKHSIIDYVEDINGSRFIINNPIAKSKCGCGNSFSI